MRADPPSVPPLLDPRALTIVVESAARLPGGSRESIVDAARNHPQSPGIQDAELRRLTNAYLDATQGFRRPTASAGYVLAGLYAIRGKVVRRIGIPFLVLLAVGGAVLGVREANHRATLKRVRIHALHQIDDARRRHQELGDELNDLESKLRARQPAPVNERAIHQALQEAQSDRNEAARLFASFRPPAELEEKRVRQLLKQSKDIEELLDRESAGLLKVTEELDRAIELQTVHDALTGQLESSGAVRCGPDHRNRIAMAYASGVRAVRSGDLGGARARLSELMDLIAQARDAGDVPARLEELLTQVRATALDDEDRHRAVGIADDGRRAAAASNFSALKDAERRLKEMAQRLEEEYTLVITGGKWRYRNNNPSAKTYYLLVEAVDSAGRKLSRRITNEEDGSVANVTVWGERVPFAVYERIRIDKQDNGVIDQNVFGRKERGRLEEQVTILGESGEVLPRPGKITRW